MNDARRSGNDALTTAGYRFASLAAKLSPMPVVAGTAIAALLGAANLGTAMAFGQLAFAAALVWVLLRW